jgi:mannose-1-phosphate guanylyltransferase/mannose-6-phosphate isomerase
MVAAFTAPLAAITGAIVPVILSGGSGTRLWPVSRKTYPKQFWPFLSKQTLLQETACRAVGGQFTAPIVVANNDHRFVVAEQLRDAGIAQSRILLEPVGRNSAPAIAVASVLAAQESPDSMLWVMAADAAITDTEALATALGTAAAAARAGHVVTFGMQPTSPETGYGYIAKGDAMPGIEGAFKVARFVEKPDAATAAGYVADGAHFWNSGMFVFTAATMIEELERYVPDVLRAARAALAAAAPDLDFIRLGSAEFAAAPDISIDYAIAEKSERAVVVPAAIGWSDVGSWSALWEAAARDEAGNVEQGDVVLEGTRNSFARSDGTLTTLLGVDNLVVVTTKDAVLVADRRETQNVKCIVDRLKRDARPEAENHNRVYRPWGFYESLIQGDRFQVKRIVVMPGHKLSLQKHHHRAEHWIVVAGIAIVTRDAEEHFVRENESIYLPLGCTHRLNNPGKIPLTLIEVQSGSYLGEDDIVRLEDTYGRS